MPMAREARHWAFVTAALIAGGALWNAFEEIRIDRRPPIVAFTAVGIPRGPVDPAVPLCVTFYRNKVRGDCPLSALRYITGDDGSFFWLPGSLNVEGGSEDEASVTICLRLPEEVHRGVTYTYRGELSYQCQSLLPFHYTAPPFRFTIAGGQHDRP